MKKISCGGFYIDENNFNIDEEGKLSLNPDAEAIPQPSDETPPSVGNMGSSGVSEQYARADHTHKIDTGSIPGAMAAMIITLVPSSEDYPFDGTYIGTTPDALKTAFLLGRKILAKLGDRYLTPSILNVDTLNFYYTYESGDAVFFVNSRLNVAAWQNTYHSSVYTGLTSV